jgi:hypothetical protein
MLHNVIISAGGERILEWIEYAALAIEVLAVVIIGVALHLIVVSGTTVASRLRSL